IALINKEIKELISVEGAFILLADKSKDQLYFLSARYKDLESEKKFKKIRFPADQGVSGRVYKTGEPMIIPDVTKCSFFLRRVDDETDLVTKNFLSVPIRLKDQTIGVVAVVNKNYGEFDNTDIELLSMVTNTIALPIENTRIHEQLRKSYKELKTLNNAKDNVINHLAHELKTPISVLSASMTLLLKKFKALGIENQLIEKIFTRGQRNLNRILDIQYEVEDLLRKKDFKTYNILNKLLDACKDELTILIENETDNIDIINSVHNSIENLFGPRKIESRPVLLNEYLTKQIEQLQPKFQHRKCLLNIKVNTTTPVNIPIEILDIITKGIIQNAIEYTPDAGKIDIVLNNTGDSPELIITDFGIGFTKEKLHLIFENFFSPPESVHYSTKNPYDFNAGGRGFDLLRIKVFSERYHFKIWIESKRCSVIPKDDDICPGDIKLCKACTTSTDCFNSGGTSVHLKFQ
ncbi:MAG: GAF domain-containing protein, partial [Desulfobacteraceae bacterium]|nr:GAF domain-containing protein [Desulfobacteraceae bacterium]